MKDELGEKIMKKSVVLRPNTYSDLMDNFNNDKKAKGPKNRVTKLIIKLGYYKNCLLNNKTQLKSQQIFNSEMQYLCTQKTIRLH